MVGITNSSRGLFVRFAAPDEAAISRVEAGRELESTLASPPTGEPMNAPWGLLAESQT